MGCNSSRPAPAPKPTVIDLAAWNLWADLDLRDEQEMMHLAKLLDALMAAVPSDPEDSATSGDDAGAAPRVDRSSSLLTSGELDIDRLEVHGKTYFAFSCQLGQQMTGTAELRRAADELRRNYARLLCNDPRDAQAEDADAGVTLGAPMPKPQPAPTPAPAAAEKLTINTTSTPAETTTVEPPPSAEPRPTPTASRRPTFWM